jgi:hypothetical protein
MRRIDRHFHSSTQQQQQQQEIRKSGNNKATADERDFTQ